MPDDTMFCPKYDENLKQMLADKSNAITFKEKVKIIKNFAVKFTLLPEQSSKFERLSNSCNEDIDLNDYSCLYSINYHDKHIHWTNKYYVISQLDDFTCKNRFKIIEEALSFPHRWLEELYDQLKFYSVYPITATIKKQYYALKTIYNELKEFENDIDKWLECIKKIQNKEAIIANFELKLGQSTNWKNKKLWKFYFGFLKENNMKEILEVFRKYTRLFICDKQAVAQYRNELDKFSSWNIPTSKYWIDTIKYEIEFGTLESAYRILERALKAVIGKPYHFVVKGKTDLCEKLETFENKMVQIENLRNCLNSSDTEHVKSSATLKPVLYYENPKIQYFCFHQSFMQNLLKNVNGTILRKLYSTCKFFYSLRKAPLCYRLEICSDKKTNYCHESLFINENDINFAGIDNLQVYNFFVVENCFSRNIVSNILPKLKYCHAKYVILQYQDLTVSELKMLLSKWLFQLYLLHVEIRNDAQNINGKTFCNLLSGCPQSEYVDYITLKQFICCTEQPMEWAKRCLPLDPLFRLEEIYFKNQFCNISDLRNFINYDMLENITLKNVTVIDENGSKMEKQKLEEFIKASVNPKNNVFIEIF